MSNPKQPGSKSVVEWTRRYEGFVAAVRRHFDFLIEHEGFEQAKVSVIPPECAVLYNRPDGMYVMISSEYHGPAWVSVRGGESLRSFGLHEFIAQLDPGYAAGKPETTSVPASHEQESLLAYQAGFLKANETRIFSNAAELFERLRRARGGGLD